MYKQVIIYRHFKYDSENKVEVYENWETFLDNISKKLNELAEQNTIQFINYPNDKIAIITYKEKRKRYGKIKSK